MRVRWRQYLLLHLVLLIGGAGFAFYAVWMQRLFPNGYFHCVMHDLLHLYCPFCGGTRAFLALLTLQPAVALRHNAVVTLAVPLVLFLDLFALLRLLRGYTGALLSPRMPVSVACAFVLYGFLRNVCLLIGFDPTGDLIKLQPRAAGITVAIFAVAGGAFCLLLLVWMGVPAVWRGLRPLAPPLLVICAAVSLFALYRFWQILCLGVVSALVGVAAVLYHKRREKSHRSS